jgi:serine O-acetyltransferase
MNIIQDLKHKAVCYYESSTARDVFKVIFTDGTCAVVLYRLAQFFVKLKLGILGYVFIEVNRIFNGCVIGRNAHFEEGLVLMHPIGVVINGGVKGGKNIVIESSVVIGAARNGLPVEVPQLGNNIFIGSGAKILGGIKIGDNVKVGANAVVLKDVPSGATVVGIPAKVIKIEETKTGEESNHVEAP